LPLTPSTVTVIESPIIRVSPTRRVRINIVYLPGAGMPSPAAQALVKA
jgi:hypothetical protein